MTTVVVTGGAGFIGSHLCKRLLDDGYGVICADNFLTGSRGNVLGLLGMQNFSLIEHDVITPLPSNLKADFVFHLASPASPNHHSKFSYHALPMETMMVNTTGTHELLTFAQRNKAKFLFASTSEVYGDPLVHPQSEAYRGNVSTTGPRSVYDEAKRFGETLTAYYWRDRGVDARIARIFNTYGPHMARADMRMIITFINMALAGESLTVFGDGTQTRSLCFIDDLVEGLVRLMFGEHTKGEVVNLGSQEEYSVLDFAKLVIKITHSKSEITFAEDLPEDDPKKRKPDISKAEQLLGWSTKVPLEEGLEKTISYFQSL